MLKEIKGLNIDWEKLKPKSEEEIEKRKSKYNHVKKYNDYRKYYGDRLTFTKKKPQTIQEIAKDLANMEPVNMKEIIDKGIAFEDLDKIQKILNSDPIHDVGLFHDEEREYDPYLDDDEQKKKDADWKSSLDQYMQDSKEIDILEPEYTADD